MKIEWSTDSPDKVGWYLIKINQPELNQYHPRILPLWDKMIAAWMGDHWSLCGESMKCVPKNVEGWALIE